MRPLQVVLLDAMTFVHLRGLGQFDLVRELGERSRKLATTAAVVRQLRQSGELGPLVNSWCESGVVRRFSPVVGDGVYRATTQVRDCSKGRLVGKNWTDIELVEVAKVERGCVVTAEQGIVRLADRRNVPCVDLVVLLAWAVAAGLRTSDQVEAATSRWATVSGAGTGAPKDYQGSFSGTVARRADIAEVVDALKARGP